MIYLKKATVSNGLWKNLSQESKEIIKAGLLESLRKESVDAIRTLVNDTVSDLAGSIATSGEWPDLLDHLFDLVKTGDDPLKQSGLLVLGQLCSSNVQLMKPFMPDIRDLTALCISSASIHVRISAIVAMTGFINASRSKAQRPLFQQLIPNILQTIGECLMGGKKDEALSILQVLVDWAEIDPIFFKPHFESLTNTMLQICESDANEDIIYLAALFITQLTTSKVTAKGLLQLSNFVSNFVNVLMRLLTRVTDVPFDEWDQDDMLSALCLGEKIETCMDKVSLSLGGKVLMPHIITPIHELLSSSEWTHVYAAIMALSLIAEGCKKQFLQNVKEIVELILPHLSSQHPRIRWVACHAIGSLSHDLSPKIQQQFQDVIIPEIAKLLDERTYTKIQIIALTSFSTFCEKVEAANLLKYLDDILKKLYNLLGSEDKNIVGETITALATVASRVMTNFTPYYETFIPYLKHILEKTHGAEYRMLRGKTFECISIIGVSVGKEKFKPDADEIMNQLRISDVGEFGKDDSNYDFLFEASARICEILKEDFVPYLPHILPKVLETAGMNPQHYMKEVDELYEEDDYQYHIVDDRKIGLHTTALEQKLLGCQILYCFINSLKDAIHPYFDHIHKVITPLLSFLFYKNIRATALSLAKKFVKSVYLHAQKTGNHQQFFDVFDDVYNRLIDALLEETELDIQQMMCERLADLIEILPPSSLSREHAHRAFSAITITVQEIDAGRIDKFSELAEEAEEEYYIDQLHEREEEEYLVLAQLAEIAGIMSRTQLVSYTPFFQENLEFVFQLVKPQNPAGNKYLGFCMIDDMMENSQGAIKEYLPYFITEMINSIVDEHPGVRHAAVYGVGVCAYRCGDLFAQYTEQALQNLVSIILSEDARDPNFTETTDNAICAFGKLLLYQQADLENLLPLWLSWLPLSTEELEASQCHYIFATFLQQNNPYLWGENFKYLPKILEIVAFCLSESGKPFVKDDTPQILKVTMIELYANGSDIVEKAISTIDQSYQAILKSVIFSP